MYKNLISLGMTLLLVSFMAACKSSKKEFSSERPRVDLVGNDKDDHGCIRSAGYQWSELLHDCIRPFEKGILLRPTANPDDTSAAYLVFNEGSSKVEVFMPKVAKRPILTKQAQDVWGTQGDLSVTYSKGVWRIFMGDVELYASVSAE